MKKVQPKVIMCIKNNKKKYIYKKKSNIIYIYLEN